MRLGLNQARRNYFPGCDRATMSRRNNDASTTQRRTMLPLRRAGAGEVPACLVVLAGPAAWPAHRSWRVRAGHRPRARSRFPDRRAQRLARALPDHPRAGRLSDQGSRFDQQDLPQRSADHRGRTQGRRPHRRRQLRAQVHGALVGGGALPRRALPAGHGRFADRSLQPAPVPRTDRPRDCPRGQLQAPAVAADHRPRSLQVDQ